MNADSGRDVERRLTAAFDAHARAVVDDQATPPPPRFAETGPRSRRAGRWLAPLAAAAAVAAVVAIVVAVTQRTTDRSDTATGPTGVSGTPVHISLLNDDGDDYGVGMPVIAYFSRTITDAKALQRATTATVNGRPTTVAWYFERSKAGKGPLEGHLRPRAYWPANSSVHVAIAAKGVAGGGGTTFDDNVSLDFRTGAATIAVVDADTHRIRVSSDGRAVFSAVVSLGAARTPTLNGTKVIMEKKPDTCLKSATYTVCHMKYVQRLTYGGEFLLAAPGAEEFAVRSGVDVSSGATKLLTADAKKLYEVMRVGDVVKYPNANGAKMTIGQGYGDWNVNWSTWLSGGAVPTR